MPMNFGIDIVDINRIKAIIIKRKNFVSKVFTGSEKAYCAGKKNPYPHYASRFAAKEAFLKAVPGWQGKLKWRELEVNNDSFGKPVITLSQESKFKLNKKKIELTISHDRNYAIALVAVEGR
ncbi:MAG: holo-ACP synthase [Candidatus Firestonebacteria bacterium]